MSENIIDRIAVRLYRAVTKLPTTPPEPGLAARSYAGKVENPALRYRALQAVADTQAAKLENQARFWGQFNVFLRRIVIVALIISGLSTLLVVREVRYVIAVRSSGARQGALVSNHKSDVPYKFNWNAIRFPFRYTVPTALVAGLIAYGGRRFHRWGRRRFASAVRRRDDFMGFVVRRRNVLHPLAADCDLLEFHLEQLQNKRAQLNPAEGEVTWLQSVLSRVFSNRTFWAKPAYFGRIRVW